MKTLVLILFFYSNFAFAEKITLSPETNNSSETIIVSDSDLLRYIDFAVRWTSYSYLGEALPQVKIVRPGLVQIFAYDEFTVAKAERDQIELPKILAVYDRYKKTIYVSNDVDVNDPKFELTLVHEIVHYLQDINGYTESLGAYIICTESEAYDIQMLWQIEFNVDKESIPFVQERSLYSAMRCMGNPF